MPDWKAQTTFGRRRNWWSFYCPEFSRPGSVADCETGGDVQLRCFTSWDSNWSLNAVLVDRESALEKKWKYARKGAAGKFGPGLALEVEVRAAPRDPPAWKSTAGLGRPDRTLKFSRSVNSTSIRLVFRLLSSSSRSTVDILVSEYAQIEVGSKI